MPKFDMSKESLPKVSVIVPIYKTPLNYFKECMDSLYNQTMQNVEFILVFDGENKKLFSISETYKDKDERFKIFIQPHLGVSATRNFGIKQAKGEYITFVDADDWIEKECCLVTYNFAKENDSDVVLFDYNPTGGQYKEKKLFSEPFPKLNYATIENLQRETIYLTDEKYVAAVSTWCKLIKKDLIEINHISFSTKLKICVDRPVSFSVFLFAKNVSYLDKVFYNYNKNENSITWTQYEERNLHLLAYLAEIKKQSNKYSSLIGKLAMEIFLNSWSTIYFIPQKKDFIRESVKKLQETAKSAEFQWLTEKFDSSKWPISVKAEAYLIHHKITFHIWLHAFKWKILSHLKKD